ncbi:Spy/CpxP family protein refolding chaperone [Massilia sp. W12]|uniref:Spy/CpxP family protein refolding chaperone n=1 Tax=Massilia sp. W12 TaxID=3126507 RepID=UPI0030D44A97
MRNFIHGKAGKFAHNMILAAALGSLLAGSAYAAAPAGPGAQKPAAAAQGKSAQGGQQAQQAQGGQAGQGACKPHAPRPDGFGLLPRGPLPDETQLLKGLEKMLAHLVPDATDAQKSAIQALAKTAAADLKPLHEQGKTVGEARETLLLAAAIDRAALEQNRSAHLRLADSISKRIDQADADFVSLLSAAQRAKIAEIIKQAKAQQTQQGQSAQQGQQQAQGQQCGAAPQGGQQSGQQAPAGVNVSPFGKK